MRQMRMTMSTLEFEVSTKSSQGRLQSVSFDIERSKISLADQRVALIERPIAQNLSSRPSQNECQQWVQSTRPVISHAACTDMCPTKRGFSSD